MPGAEPDVAAAIYPRTDCLPARRRNRPNECGARKPYVLTAFSSARAFFFSTHELLCAKFFVPFLVSWTSAVCGELAQSARGRCGLNVI